MGRRAGPREAGEGGASDITGPFHEHEMADPLKALARGTARGGASSGYRRFCGRADERHLTGESSGPGRRQRSGATGVPCLALRRSRYG
jgi:hypothetical protein